MREETVYYCDACNTAYTDKEDAVSCEISHAPKDAPPPKYVIGDILQYCTTLDGEEDIQYARFDEYTNVFWDLALKTWVYRLRGNDIKEEDTTLAMSNAEYGALVQDIYTKLRSEYTVVPLNRFPGPHIDIRLYPLEQDRCKK